ncbi:MAG: DinB family protein, partial [Calditrichia bacterium]|nr:DinB family protein [Calditrichia bacterium]
MPIFCQEYLGQIDFVRGRITQLAEAVPQEKYNWRPAEGVRSVSEVYRHTALANYNLLKSSGFELPEGIDLGKDRETWVKATTNKEEIIASLNQSFDDVSDMVKKVSEDDLNKMLKVFGMEMSMRNFMITLLNHMHEHLGQSIAYARMNGIVPPWSAPP